jgi:energy-coupling factor transporter ATP-binding protein EcfA2
MTDRLPPFSEQAERMVLGCLLLNPALWESVAVRIGDGTAFYSLQHRTIYAAMTGLSGEGRLLDVVTLTQRLHDSGQLQAAGGRVYVSTLADEVPASAAVMEYVAIVLEKYTARRFLATCTEAAAQVYETESTIRTLLGRTEEQLNRLSAEVQAQVGTPRRLRLPMELGDEYLHAWFGDKGQEPGAKLPESAFGDFPFRIRDAELTFTIGETGAGKTTFLSYLILHLLAQGKKAVLASMEIEARITLKLLAAQLLGRRKLPDDDWGHARARVALEWLHDRVWLYDFLGIADWRDILQHFRFAAGKGANLFLVDSVMRLGIPDDDLAQQGLAAMQFSHFAMETRSHVLVVNHMNKSDADVKRRSRGSAQWLDNAHNICALMRNEKKGARFDELMERRRLGQVPDQEFAKELEDLRGLWDAKFVLVKQRMLGGQQNASRYLFFERGSLQYFDHPDHPPMDWLGEWRPVPAVVPKEKYEAAYQTANPNHILL